jgi:hypothetical protein
MEYLNKDNFTLYGGCESKVFTKKHLQQMSFFGIRSVISSILNYGHEYINMDQQSNNQLYIANGA